MEDHLRSRSVTSSPSRNICKLFPDDPPAPAWPSAAKCWAWSTTSSRRSRKASQIYFSMVTVPCQVVYLGQHLRNPICLVLTHTTEQKVLLGALWCGRVTYISIIVFPKPYQNPPAPTRFDSRTLQASAFNAFRTRDPNGVGILKSAQLLYTFHQNLRGSMTWEYTNEYITVYASQSGSCILLNLAIWGASTWKWSRVKMKHTSRSVPPPRWPIPGISCLNVHWIFCSSPRSANGLLG